ncbi:hypothetical protein [Streptomyces sp. NPDC001978]|uniref:hypothetical protein n=1 Tax=Streptomyces sp. NPDC001978 TaxID=3364627 RepID=UPI0036BD3171
MPADLAVVTTALNGDASGGAAEGAPVADTRIASHDVVTGFTQVRLNPMPAWGIERLTQLGRGRATYLLTLGTVSAPAKPGHGRLFGTCVPRAQFAAVVEKSAARIVQAPQPMSVGMTATTQQAYPAIHNGTAESAVDAFSRARVFDDHWTAPAALNAPLGSATSNEGPG